MNIPITKVLFGEEELRAVQIPLETGWVVQGPFVKQFEDEFNRQTGAAASIATSSCTTALHIAVAAPYAGESQDGSTVPQPVRFDDDLRIRGNVIWDGPVDHPSGLGGDDAGCGDDNSGCNDTQYRADNAVNVERPLLRAPERGDYTPLPTSVAALAARSAKIPPFGWADAPVGVPTGTLINTVGRDRAGAERGPSPAVGAYAR